MMITRSESPSQTIEEWIDQFEASWSVGAWIHLLESNSHVSPNDLIEIARVDIDLHYMRGHDVDLQRYEIIGEKITGLGTTAFPNSKGWREALAFEDFRGRNRSHFRCDPQRWLSYLSPPYPAWLSCYQESSPHTESATDFVPKSLLQARWPISGDRFGEFEIVEQIGSGSFSQVYLATQTTLGRRKVVLKLTTQKQDEPEWLGRFQHENIVPVYSVHQWKEFHVLCMPFWGTLTLASWMRDQPNSHERNAQQLSETLNSAKLRLPSTLLDSVTHAYRSEPIPNPNQSVPKVAEPTIKGTTSIETAMCLFEQLASALKHSHSHGILHGDLKPANVLLRSNGAPALLDFNLSQETNHVTTRVKGSTPYMAPEQLRGWSNKTPLMTQGTDLYALGLMLYEYLNGSLPEVFRQSISPENLEEITEKRCNYDFSQNLREVPPGLRNIVLKALRPSTKDRYASAAELQEDLSREASHQSLAFANDPIWNRCRKLLQRNKNAFSASSVVAVSLLICLIAVISAWQWRRIALKHDAIAHANDFLFQSQRLLGELHSVEGTLDHGVALRLVNLAENQSPNLFGQSANTTWQWLGDLEKKRLREGWENHILFTTYAMSRTSKSAEDGSRQACLDLCQSLPSDFSKLSLSVTELLSGSPRTMNWERLEDFVDNPLLLATIAGDQRDWGKARNFLDRVSESERTHGLYWFLLGRNQLMLDDLESATSSFGLAKDRAELRVLALFGRGVTYLRRQQAEKAIEDFSEVIRLSPNLLDTYIQRSRALELSQQWESSLADLNHIIEREPFRTTARYMRIRILEQLGKTSEAFQDRQLILSTEPKHAIDFVTRALSRLPQDIAGAWSDLDLAGELDPLLPAVWQNKSYIASTFQNDDRLAVKQLDELLSICPCDVEGLSGRAVLHARLKNDEQAVADIEKALRLMTAGGGPTHFHASCVFSLLSVRDSTLIDRANAHLAKALQYGYGLELVADDVDLGMIRNTQQFQEIVRVAHLANQAPTSQLPQ